MRKGASGHPRRDPTFYPIEEKVGEDILQRWIVELLRPLVERWLDERRDNVLVGADQFVYYQQHNPHARVAPDVYVLPGVRKGTRVRSWKTWETGIVPSFALEVVSLNWEKDYAEVPERYAALGVNELVVFDPDPSNHPDGLRWQVYRRARKRLTRIEVSQSDRIRSRVLGCYLRVVGDAERQRVRLGIGPRGETLFPTYEEAERAKKEAALVEKEAALARIAELEAELARRRST